MCIANLVNWCCVMLEIRKEGARLESVYILVLYLLTSCLYLFLFVLLMYRDLNCVLCLSDVGLELSDCKIELMKYKHSSGSSFVMSFHPTSLCINMQVYCMYIVIHWNFLMENNTVWNGLETLMCCFFLCQSNKIRY